VKPKSPSIRFIPFGPKTLQILGLRREREPEADYVLGNSPQRILRRLSHQLRIVCDRIGLSGVTFHILHRMFFARLASGGRLDSCIIIGGWSSHSVATKSILSMDDRFKIAARDQARIEEEL
jgi:integrase